MISRTLGPEFGGSIGTLFFLANVVGCGLAVTGCAEGLIENFGPGGFFANDLHLPDGRWWRFFYCTLITVVILIVCLVGAGLFAKTSVLILGIVTICLMLTYFSFLVQGPLSVNLPEENKLVGNITQGNYTGLSSRTFSNNLHENYTKDYSSEGRDVTFAITFGVLFSGVTGNFKNCQFEFETNR